MTVLTRRDTLAGAAAALAAGPLAADRGSFVNPAYARLVEAECGLVVPENEMKWQALRPTPTVFAWERVMRSSLGRSAAVWPSGVTICYGISRGGSRVG